MTGNTRIKLALAVAGLALFAAGVRLDNLTLRWIAIGIVAIAFLLRFVRPDKPHE
jgi:predicted permease